jgi:probable phosphoglycerate mutase
MKVFLARHGQSCWQLSKEEGNWNSPLSPLGQTQAVSLANWLAEHTAVDAASRIEIGQIRVSPLVRAQQTAVPIAQALNHPIITDQSLQEADFWIPDHLPRAESPYQSHPIHTPSPEYAAFKKQAISALHTLAADAEATGKPSLGIAHGGLISTMLREVVGNDAISFWIYNTTLQLLEWQRGRWHLVYLNLWDHLPPEMRTF